MRRGSSLRRRYGRARPSIAVQLARVERLLDHAIAGADRRGYTGMLHSKGSLFDDPKVARLMKRRDALLKRR